MTMNRENTVKILCFTCGLTVALVAAYAVSQTPKGSNATGNAVEQPAVMSIAPLSIQQPIAIAETSVPLTKAIAEVKSTTKSMSVDEPTLAHSVTFTDANFVDQVLKSSKPVLVDMWAEWCMPCRAMAPVIDQAAEAMGSDVLVGKLNVDENPRVARAIGVKALPTMLIFKDGKIVDAIVGMASQQEIVAKLQAVVEHEAT
jgi:thioredoxin 1